MLLEVLNDKHSCQLSEKLPSLVLLSSSVSTTNLYCLLATTFSSLRFLFNFTSLQSFESGQPGFLFSHFRSVLSSILRWLNLERGLLGLKCSWHPSKSFSSACNTIRNIRTLPLTVQCCSRVQNWKRTTYLSTASRSPTLS